VFDGSSPSGAAGASVPPNTLRIRMRGEEYALKLNLEEKFEIFPLTF
jgi:hypothetical protein